MRISLIAAVAENGVIGRRGQLPWHVADDLRRFKQLTMGHTIIMGRKTWESIGRPLPRRRIVVISLRADYRSEGVETVDTLDAAIAVAKAAGDQEAFIIGGAEVYRLALPRAHRMYLTRIHAAVDGDVFFPEYVATEWRQVSSERCAANEENDFAFTFEVFDRA